jgi:predicted SAM-dependent methyltransferase
MGVARLVKGALRGLGVEVTRGPHAVLIRHVGRHRATPGDHAGAHDLRLNLGCGPKPLPGYLNVDIAAAPEVDLVAPVTELPMLPDGCAVEVRLDAVFEHLYRWERPRALAEWHRLLAPGGRLCLNWIPDFDLYARLYLDHAPGILGAVFDLEHVYRFSHGLPTEFNAPYQLHKDVFTKDMVRAELAAAGYSVESLADVVYEDEPYAVNFNAVARRP